MRQLLVILWLMGCTSLAFAVKVSSLYQADVLVASQSAEARAEAAQQGLLKVLMKVTGDADIANNPIIRGNLARADYFIEEYSYLFPDPNSAHYIIQIHYSKNDVNRLLKRAGLSHWGENRPLILVWLVVSDAAHGTEIIGNESPGDILNTMKLQGRKFGLPLIFPAMDMTDTNMVSAEDIKVMVLPVLREAGARYAPDAYLIGKVDVDENGLKGQWQLNLGENQWNFAITGPTMDAMAQSVLSQVTDTLAKHYGVRTNEPKRWLILEIMNITERKDLVELMDYLRQLPSVQQVQLAQIAGYTVQLSVLLRGTLNNFQQSAEMGNRLILQSQGAPTGKLVYEWIH
jgi:uncharacterized protein